jgi:hypothetical protein
VSEFRYFESGYFEPFFDGLFELEDEEPVEDVLGQVMTGSRPVARLRLLRDRAEEEREDEEALIALLTAALR